MSEVNMKLTIFVIHFLVIVGNLTFIASYELSKNSTATNADQDRSIDGYANDATLAGDGQRNFESGRSQEDEEARFWSDVLEDWTLRQGVAREREGRIIQTTGNRYIPTTSGNFYISRRIGEAMELEPLYRRPPPGPGKVISSQGNPNSIPQSSYGGFSPNPTRQGFAGGNQFIGGGQNQGSPREVSETDLYLLSAIEKLVYRVDYLEQRLRRTEQIVYYLMAGNKEVKPEVSLCPENFTRIGDNCYFFGTDRSLNWKSANSACKSLGAHLAEFDTKAKYNEVVAVIQKSASQRGKDFWLGGLNPGLLWIWSNAGKPVNPNFNVTSLTNSAQNSTKIVNNPTQKPAQDDNKKDGGGPPLDIKGSGRCLRLTWLAKAEKYLYFGQECSIRHNYLCELVDNTLDNEIKRIAKELKFG